MKEYLVCANSSYTNGVDGGGRRMIKADDIDSAIEAANQVLNTVKSVLSFVRGLDVKSVSEITE